MKKITKFAFAAILAASLVGTSCVLTSKYLDKSIEAKAAIVNVSTLAQLQDALATADDTTVIHFENTINQGSVDDLVLDGHGATLCVSEPYISEAGRLQDDIATFIGPLFRSTTGKTVTLKNMTIMGGRNSDSSAAISIASQGMLNMDNVTITRSNRGIYLESEANAIITNSNIVRNAAPYAGGILCSGGTLVMDNCSLSENRSTSLNGGGGAIEVRFGGKFIANNTVIINNSSTEIGGAINNQIAEVYLMNCTVSGNVTTAGIYDGGGLGANTSTLGNYIVNSLFIDNYFYDQNSKSFSRSDIGYYDARSNVTFINSVASAAPVRTEGYGSYTEISSTIDPSSSIATNYRNDTILIPYARTGNFVHPASLTKTNGVAALYVPVDPTGSAASGGIETYIDYSDLTDVKMGYGPSSDITALGELNAPTSADKVTSYFEGTSRVDGIIGASGTSSQVRYTVKMGGAPRNQVEGITAYGDSYLYGDIVNFSTSDFGFVKWLIEVEGQTPYYSTSFGEWITVENNTLITPLYSNNTVSFSANGGEGTYSDVVADTGTSYTLPANPFTPPEHKEFVGWARHPQCTASQVILTPNITIDDDFTLYAIWRYVSVTITFNANGGSGSKSPVAYLRYSSRYYFPSSPNPIIAPAHMEFNGWGTYNSVSGEIEAVSGSYWDLTGDVEFYAMWKYVKQTISFDANGGTGSLDPVQAEYNSEYTLPANPFTTPDVNKHFAGWSTSSDGDVISSSSIIVEGDTTLYAIWAYNTHTVTFHGNGGTGIVSPEIVSYNDIYPMPTNQFTNPHNHFVGWSYTEDGSAISSWPITITDDIDLYALWEIDSHEISFNANGGSGSLSPINRTYGSSYSLPENPFTAPDHKHFAGWSYTSNGDIISTSSITIEDDTELFAIWAYDYHTISFNANGGTGSADPVSKEYSSSYTLPDNPFTAPDHKHFVGWSYTEDGEAITSSTIVISGDTTLFALWATDVHTVTISAGEGTGSSIVVNKEYGSSYTLPNCEFTAPEGKEFDGWMVNGEKHASGDTITISEDTVITAVWKDIPAAPVANDDTPVTPTPTKTSLPTYAIVLIVVIPLFLILLAVALLVYYKVMLPKKRNKEGK